MNTEPANEPLIVNIRLVSTSEAHLASTRITRQFEARLEQFLDEIPRAFAPHAGERGFTKDDVAYTLLRLKRILDGRWDAEVQRRAAEEAEGESQYGS